MQTQLRLEEKFKDFISQDGSPYYFYIHDTNGVFTYISETVFDILGFTPDEFKKFYLECVTGNPINKEMIRYTNECLKGIQQDPYEVEVYDKDYNTHRLYVYETPVIQDGKVIAVEGIAKLLN